MEQQIVGRFALPGAAEQARVVLLASGLRADQLAVRVTGDEAGAMQGNFAVGDPPAQSRDGAYEAAFASRPQAGQVLLIVSPDDPAQAQRAAELLDSLGAGAPGPA